MVPIPLIPQQGGATPIKTVATKNSDANSGFAGWEAEAMSQRQTNVHKLEP